MAKKIKIKSLKNVTGGDDKSDLIGCYFLQTNEPGKYIFFEKDDTPIVTNPMPVSGGDSFRFQLRATGTDTWMIPDPLRILLHPFVITELPTGHASGSWRTIHHSPPLDDEGDGESGTFQATTGSTPVEDPEGVASAAKA